MRHCRVSRRAAHSDIAECDPFFVLPAEVGFHKSEPDQKDFSDLHDFLEANRFHFCGIYDSYRYGSAKRFVGFSKAIYINNDFTSSPKRNSDKASQDLGGNVARMANRSAISPPTTSTSPSRTQTWASKPVRSSCAAP